MNIDRQLPNSVDINIAPATGIEMFQLQGGTGAAGVRDGETFAVPVYTQRVDANFGPVTDIVVECERDYNALVLEARRRSRGRAGVSGELDLVEGDRLWADAARRRGRMGSSIRSMCSMTEGFRR